MNHVYIPFRAQQCMHNHNAGASVSEFAYIYIIYVYVYIRAQAAQAQKHIAQHRARGEQGMGKISARSAQTRGVWGHAPPGKFFISDILRWFLVQSGK